MGMRKRIHMKMATALTVRMMLTLPEQFNRDPSSVHATLLGVVALAITELAMYWIASVVGLSLAVVGLLGFVWGSHG